MHTKKNTNNFIALMFVFMLFCISCSNEESPTEIIEENNETDNTLNPTEPIPDPNPIDNAEKAAAIALYNTYYLPSKTSNTDPKWNGNTTSCNTGSAAKEVRDKILTRIHYFRKATGLHNTITENIDKSKKAMQAALIMHANKELDHNPPYTWSCYTEEGAKGAAASLLTTAENAEAIDSYMRDFGANNGPVGHRRWIYHPKLEEIGIGNTSSYNAIYVLGSSGSTVPDDAPEFISWPPKGYIPARFAYDRWSFSYPKANFDNTTITITDSSGNKIPTTILPLKTGFGDNTLVWEPEDINRTIKTDTRYTVTLSKVLINNESKTFRYDITLFEI